MKKTIHILIVLFLLTSNVCYSQKGCFKQSAVNKNDKKINFANKKATLTKIEAAVIANKKCLGLYILHYKFSNNNSVLIPTLFFGTKYYIRKSDNLEIANQNLEEFLKQFSSSFSDTALTELNRRYRQGIIFSGSN